MSDAPLLVAPIGASALLAFALPASPLAQPRALVGGNVLLALIGVACALLIPHPALACAAAVGLALTAMALAGCLHPPGGAIALAAALAGAASESQPTAPGRQSGLPSPNYRQPPRIDSPHRPRSNGRMDIKPLGIGFILFGILAIGGTLDGARRKFAAQPEWVALNWKSVLLGLIGWLVAGALAVLVGVVMLVV